MRILVTNDDGIDSIGLHKLALAMLRHGDVVVAAPDQEFSGAGASLGPLSLIHPEMRKRHVEGVPEAWTINGPPALIAMFARLGAFGDDFDLVVSGINPGANVGRSVYHSGTIGACLTARSGGTHGIAVSQAVKGYGIEGQGWDRMLSDQHWDTAAEVADAFVEGFIADLPDRAMVVNLNVPNLALDEIKGWQRCEVGTQPPRSMAKVTLDPIEGHEDAYCIKMGWGRERSLPEHTDGGALERDRVSVTYLSGLEACEVDHDSTNAALDRLIGR